MPAYSETKPVEDTVSKVNDEIAVGSDPEFQRRWSRFENVVWAFFGLFVLADLAGCFGRGPVATAEAQTKDGTLHVKYERIERFSTPSILTVEFDPSAIKNGNIQLWVSEDLVKPLGNQRVVPQPISSSLGNGGILYTFLAHGDHSSVEFALEPASPGIDQLTFRTPGGEELKLKIYVVP